MKKIDIAYIVLNYMAYQETIKCVEYINKNSDTKDYIIVVIDNNSHNDSYEKLKDIFCEEKKLVLIKNSKNLGFAKGNNVGINYVLNNFIFDYIAVLNNDVYLLEKNLLKKIEEEKKNSNFSVLGPLILTADGRYDSNPVEIINDLKNLNCLVKQIKKELIFINLKLYRIYNFYMRFIYFVKNKINKSSKKVIYERKENVKLHGSFLVFSKNYFNIFDGFDDRTFLYLEEDILYFNLMNNNMINVFCPDIIVYHKEDASTNMINKNPIEKVKFIYENHLKSADVLIDIINKKNHME